ncbi:MAG: ThiF family adenylyltransferase [Bacillota bacterium]|nr:ThiF family adenylyltransferase [Bacillota bacterium]
MVNINDFSEDRFSRFGLISWWDQKKLSNAKVLVIGAGALGNEILKNLSLLGVGNIFLVDMDLIENSNLSRSILFREKNNGKYKSEIAAQAVKDIFPQVNINYLCGNVLFDLGLGVFRWADVVVAGLDNREARLFINRCCWKTNTPWIDGAIEQLNGVARVFVPPDGSCYECAMSKVDMDIIRLRKSCSLLTRDEMLEGKVPTTPTSASVIAGIQCQEAVKLIHGLPVLKSKGFIFNGLTHDSYIIEYPRKDECFSHETYENIEDLDISIADIKLKSLLSIAKERLGNDAIIELNHEIVSKLDCPSCGFSKEVYKILGNVKPNEAICEKCGSQMTPSIFHNFDINEDIPDKTFQEIGIPPFDIIKARSGLDECCFCFFGDAQKVLGSQLI